MYLSWGCITYHSLVLVFKILATLSPQYLHTKLSVTQEETRYKPIFEFRIFVACNQHLAGLRGVRVNGEGWSPGGVERQLLDGIWESIQPCSFF